MRDDGPINDLSARPPYVTGRTIRRMMKHRRLTIRALAQAMDVTRARVRYVRTNGVPGGAAVRDWMEGIAEAKLRRDRAIADEERPMREEGRTMREAIDDGTLFGVESGEVPALVYGYEPPACETIEEVVEAATRRFRLPIGTKLSAYRVLDWRLGSTLKEDLGEVEVERLVCRCGAEMTRTRRDGDMTCARYNFEIGHDRGRGSR